MNGQRGMSLIEMMVSIGLLTLASAMMFKLFADAQRTTSMQANRLENTKLASTVLTKLNRTYMGSDKVSRPKGRVMILSNDAGTVTYETKCLKTENPTDTMPEEMVRCLRCRPGSLPMVKITTKTSDQKSVKTIQKGLGKLNGASLCFYQQDDNEHQAVLDLHYPNQKNEIFTKKALLVKNLNEEIKITLGSQ